MSDIESKSSLVNKVVLVNLSFGVVGNTKQVTKAILATDADVQLLHVHKKLLDSPELEAITSADAQVRNYVKRICMPYDTGLLLLPLGLRQLVHDKLTAYEAERADLVDKFMNKYAELCEDALKRLGSLYNALDYPSPEVIYQKFYFDYQYLSFAPPGAEQMAELTDEAKAKFQQKVAQITDEITVVMRQNLFEMVEHLKDSLEPNADGKPKRLFASSVTNIQDFLDTFKARNITNDGDLEKIVTELQSVIHPGFSVDVLRNDDSFKSSIHDKMLGISGQLSDLVEVVPGRKFKSVA